MKKILFSLLALVVLLGIVLFAIGPQKALIWVVSPHHDFSEDTPAASPDYTLSKNWAALPETEDLADMRPAGVRADTLMQSVDVFFIHPTGYLKGETWNSSMDPNSSTEENTKWMMANEASAFSDAKVYAPRYREATIFAFIDLESPNAIAALDLAYQDVERAFDYFLENYNKNRPLIIASHSQGSYHALTLLKNKIDGTDLRHRMIAAYTIGISRMSDENVATLKNIPVCDDPAQNNCLIHWATFAEGAEIPEGWDGSKMVCVNPLTWKRDDGRAEKDKNQGYVRSSGDFTLKFHGDDEAENVEFKPLEAPKVAHTCATCKDGILYVEEQPESKADALGKGNYHGLDYLLFHMDIRKNVSLRTRAYFEQLKIAEAMTEDEL